MTATAEATRSGSNTRRSVVAPAITLVVAAFGAFLAFLDSTIVNVAFPSIQQAFPHASFDSLSWVLNAYNIIFGAFLVAAGRIADLLGRRKMFISGVAVFTLASAGCAAAGSVDTLIAFRMVQAFGAAILVPASLAAVVEAFPAEHRAHGIGLWGAAAALASGLGPPIGGALVEADNWRLAFLVNVPLGIIAIILAQRVLVESRAPGRRSMPDLRGAALLAIALGTLTLGVVKGQDWGWISGHEGLALLGVALASGAFVLSSRHHPSPLLDMSLLRIRPFLVANLATAIAAMGFYAYLLTHILWLHYVWHYSLLRAGLAVAPGALIAAAVAAVLGKIADERGHRVVALPGAIVWAAGFVWYVAVVGTHPHFLTQWLPGQIISGIGVGATLPVLGSAALAAVPGGRYASASAIVSSTRQIGAVLGISLLVVIIGVPSPLTVVTNLRHGWVFCGICFAVTALVIALLPRGVASAAADAHTPDAAIEPAARAATSGAPVLEADPATRHLTVVRDEASGRPAPNDELGDLAVFADLDPIARARVAAVSTRVWLQAGEWLFQQGDVSDSLYSVRCGRLEVLVDGTVVRELGRGSTLGELGVLTGEPRSASVRARRDSRLLRIGAADFHDLTQSEPSILRTVAATVASWLQTGLPTTDKVRTGRVIAVIGLDAIAPVSAVTHALAERMRDFVTVATPGRIEPSGLERAEGDNDLVLLSADATDGDWHAFCLRQADRFVFVAGATRTPRPSALPIPEGQDLVLIGERPGNEELAAWHDLHKPRRSYLLPSDDEAVVAGLRPLAARLAGRSIGLVLGGGGARALAHVGVLEVLEANGVEVDRVAGASFGALVGALYAVGNTAAEVDAIMYNGLVRGNPLNDYTMPRKALTRGRKVLAELHETFDGALIEGLQREYCAVSVDLLARSQVIHRRGSVADAVAASMRLPGVFPPLLLDNRLHIDGGVLNNLPVDVLSAAAEGPVIAVAISLGGSGRSEGRTPRIPAIGDTLMRAIMLTGSAASERGLSTADIVIQPDAAHVGLLEFHQLDAMRESGRIAAEAAMPQIEALLARLRRQADVALPVTIAPAPPVVSIAAPPAARSSTPSLVSAPPASAPPASAPPASAPPASAPPVSAPPVAPAHLAAPIAPSAYLPTGIAPSVAPAPATALPSFEPIVIAPASVTPAPFLPAEIARAPHETAGQPSSDPQSLAASLIE